MEIVNINEAKVILNHQKKTPYTEQEIIEIVKLLETFSEIISENLNKFDTQ